MSPICGAVTRGGETGILLTSKLLALVCSKRQVSRYHMCIKGRGGGEAVGYCFAAQKPFVCLEEAQKQTLCSLLTSDMLDIQVIPC